MIYKIKECKICKNPFNGNSPNQKVCDGCRTHKCVECGKTFVNSSYNKKNYKASFCCMDCYHKNRWGISKECRWCGKKTGGKRFCNEECQRSFWNKNEYKLLKKKRIWERKIGIIRRLGGECVHCGIKDIRVLEINHIDRGKKKRPNKNVYNWTRRLKEWNENIKNLELLCGNCHKIHTWEQMGYGKGTKIPELDEKYFNIAKERITKE